MHNVTHSLAHRAPPASRTRGRWQPYAAIASSSSSSASSSRVSPAIYLSTPATSVSPSPAHKTPTCDISLINNPTSSKDSGNRTKFALSLVDQSVKSLCDIWRPQDIPYVFNCPKSGLGATDVLASKLQSQRLTKAGPASPILGHPALARPTVPTAPTLLQTGTSDTPSNLVPVRGFVHEVLRRSRTSGGVLQTALCYLEAIRPKLAELIQQERQGVGMRGEVEQTSEITVATEAELELEAELAKLDQVSMTVGFSQPADTIIDTIRIVDDESNIPPKDSWMASAPSMDLEDASPSPVRSLEQAALPSPLLCPRRTFLAALILASKFTQDKCYSNRAWAKLSGLPPREIGRCERALGNALEWRLWVGKAAGPAAPTASSSTPIHKPVARSQSEPSLVAPSPSSPKRTLARSDTLPADAFLSVRRSSTTDAMDVSVKTPTSLEPTGSAEGTFSSPLSDVPSLSYSPSSTESSSSGERTIQMSTFLEDNMSLSSSEQSQTWPWTESEGGMCPADNHTLTSNSSPVAMINGRLLTGNGLSGFQTKTMLLRNAIGLFGSSPEAQIPNIRGDGVCIYDPGSGFASTTSGIEQPYS